jgi:hypothetical protein
MVIEKWGRMGMGMGMGIGMGGRMGIWILIFRLIIVFIQNIVVPFCIWGWIHILKSKIKTYI